MFGLDSWIVHFSDGTTLAIVLVVAVLLGLRHASDPDHLAAVTTLVTNGRGGATRLGLTSFGGPVAHLGYFHDEYVRRRRWLDEASYADLVALCQFLPGPASSQVGSGTISTTNMAMMPMASPRSDLRI